MSLFETLAQATKPENLLKNREIQFRGKTQIGDHWVYGSLVICRNGDHCIADQGAYGQGTISSLLKPDTVGQFTGLKDKNGVEIYEGDLLRYAPETDWDKENFTAFEVFYHDGDMADGYNIGWSIGRCHHQGAICGGITWGFKPKTVSKMVVIGNIHDNPELLS